MKTGRILIELWRLSKLTIYLKGRYYHGRNREKWSGLGCLDKK